MDSPTEVFVCDRRTLTLTKAGCSRLFQSANTGKAPHPWEGRAACRGCPIGSMHATGRLPNPMARYQAWLKLLCARCFRPADRLIWGIYCPSCDARQREAIRGRNAKGNRPGLSDRLHTEHLVFAVGEQVRVIHRPVVASLPEALMVLARTAAAPAAFGRRRVHWPALTRNGRRKPWTSQLELCL